MKKVMLSALLLSLPLLGYAQERFPSPEAAANAFAAAVAGKNETQLTALLGDEWRQFLPPEGADPEAVARFNRDWREGHRIVQKDNTAHLNVGREDWQLPVPMVKEAGGWRFDMAAAGNEILTRTIGRNELSTLQAMHAYVDAQQDYYLQNHRWAHRIISSEAKKMACTGQPKQAKSPVHWAQTLAPQRQTRVITATISALSAITTVTARRFWPGRCITAKPE